VLWFFGKVLFFIFIFIWLRGSLPRLRYDQFMAFGWKRLIPISLVWILAVATMRVARDDLEFDRQTAMIAAGVLLGVFLLLFLIPEGKKGAAEATEVTTPRTGGFPVPPMPIGGPVRGGARPLVFASSEPTVSATSGTTSGTTDGAEATNG